MKKTIWYEFTKGIYKENPILVTMLGLCPTLAITTQTINGISMGVAVIIVLLGSNIIISLIKNIIPSNIRIPCYIVVIATLVTLIQITLQAFLPEVNESLGIFIPLIVVNCLILGRAEAFASKNNVLKSIMDALGSGIGFTIVLTFIALIREIIGSGQITLKIAGYGAVYDLGSFFQLVGIVNASGDKAPLTLFLLPPGGFIVLGLLMGMMNFLQRQIKNRILIIKKKKLLAEKPDLKKLEENQK
jgi:electron transport complex protein RnfE